MSNDDKRPSRAFMLKDPAKHTPGQRAAAAVLNGCLAQRHILDGRFCRRCVDLAVLVENAADGEKGSYPQSGDD